MGGFWNRGPLSVNLSSAGSQTQLLWSSDRILTIQRPDSHSLPLNKGPNLLAAFVASLFAHSF